ncbi:putative Non-hemolytic phospholipase C [Venustampulla echinocandica]|uniref:Putative Non-hemolytic phospholipase C n=1 Tax=Venustampulla echinocandica TaxID=2656787 RepID=A0A370U118_9HELO|nr:putative Non-hemolytic phospholipase C [Venustampulla echinocandica]RDL41464.1 putative Non-hemolytic phospholipase C [Venustampulla echinocandica]
MPGVRGFADPNVQINPDGRTTFQQLLTPKQTKLATQLTPWHINYLGGTWPQATQCLSAGENSWEAMHLALNGGLTNKWAITNTPYSWSYLNRSDIPVHFDIAEGWTVGDMYQEGVLGATSPNRVLWMSGTLNNPGTPNNIDGEGDMILDNHSSPGCERPHLNCFPFTWKTLPEYWQDAGVTWQVYQDADNFEDNPLAYFDQYQRANEDSPLNLHGNSYIGLDQFYEDAANGTLPQISIIIGPAELSEHSPYLPGDGAWLQKQVVEAVVNGPAYHETALIISYDEVGGYGDHVTPFHAPKGTPGEWIDDPYGLVGETPIGPGFRLPFYIISPWTRGGHVFTEHADHNSQILFIEEWLEATGKKNIRSKEMSPWRREHMSNLLYAFDFEHPDYSIPHIAHVDSPLTYGSPNTRPSGRLGSTSSNYIGAAMCQAKHRTSKPPVPYGPQNANANPAKLVEEGFKQVRGSLTEGRYITFEMNGFALTNAGWSAMHVTSTPTSPRHDSVYQRWVAHLVGDAGGDLFVLRSAFDWRYISRSQQLTDFVDMAEVFRIVDLGAGKGYALMPRGVSQDGLTLNGQRKGRMGGGLALGVSREGEIFVTVPKEGFMVFSVTYHS